LSATLTERVPSVLEFAPEARLRYRRKPGPVSAGPSAIETGLRGAAGEPLAAKGVRSWFPSETAGLHFVDGWEGPRSVSIVDGLVRQASLSARKAGSGGMLAARRKEVSVLMDDEGRIPVLSSHRVSA
jgi:hypothetical protein